MSALIGSREFRAMLAAAVARVREGSDYLSQLDAAGGDGDHGTTMRRAMSEIEKTLATHSEARLHELIGQVGWELLSIDGGATGPLLGSFFLGIAEEVGERSSLDTRGLAGAFEAGGARVRKQSKAQAGDKTMLDALLPALIALRAAADAGKDPAQALGAAAEAAARGAEATRDWLPKFGKARFSGERTRGYPDPGATSLAMIFAGFSAGIHITSPSNPDGQTSRGHLMLKKAEKEIVCVAQFIAKEGKENELLQALHRLIAPTHQEAGYLRYELNQAIDNPRAITFIEKFRSQEDFDFHCNTPYIKGFFDNVAPPLMEGVTVTLYKEILP